MQSELGLPTAPVASPAPERRRATLLANMVILLRLMGAAFGITLGVGALAEVPAGWAFAFGYLAAVLAGTVWIGVALVRPEWRSHRVPARLAPTETIWPASAIVLCVAIECVTDEARFVYIGVFLLAAIVWWLSAQAQTGLEAAFPRLAAMGRH